MSRILRRPMFRGGGPVSSYGNGITAPLVPGYQGGGQIGGGIIYGKPMADGRYGFENPVLGNITMPNNILTNTEQSLGAGTGITLGSDLLRAANQKLRANQAYEIPAGVAMKEKETETDGKATTIEDVDTNVVDGSVMQSDFDQTKTVTLDNGETVQVSVDQSEVAPSAQVQFMIDGDYEKYKENKKLEELDLKKEVDRIQSLEPIDTSGNDLPPSMRGLKEIEDLGLSQLEKDLKNQTESPEISAKDAIAENQELFKELLGSKKARGQDISDMLLRFSGSQGNTLGEKFQNYTRAESAAGPGRGEKINQTAAALAINDYVAGKRAQEQGELLTKKIDYELDAKNKYLTPQEGDTNAEILRKISTAYKIEPGSNKAIKQLLKFRNPGKKIYGITKDPSKVKAKDLEIGLNIVTHKGAKTIIEKISETETKIIPFSGI